MSRRAHLLLAVIRLVNGTAALVAPEALARRLDVDTDRSPGLLYFQRMFGIRTILLGLELLFRDGGELERTLRIGRVIHACDMAAAVIAGRRGNLARRPAVLATLISAVNLLLAVVARPARR